MKKYFQTLLLLASFGLISVGHAGDLNEAAVNNFLNKLDAAIEKLDVNGVAATMSDAVDIILNIDMQGQKQVMQLTKAQYVDMLRQGWAAYSNYKYSRSNVKVKMNGNSALVTADVSETMTVQGQTMTGNSKEEVTVELQNGQPVITKIVGYTSM